MIKEQLYFVMRLADKGMVKGQIRMRYTNDRGQSASELRYETRPAALESYVLEDIEEWLFSQGVDPKHVSGFLEL